MKSCTLILILFFISLSANQLVIHKKDGTKYFCDISKIDSVTFQTKSTYQNMVKIPAKNAVCTLGIRNILIPSDTVDCVVYIVNLTYDFWMDTTEVTQHSYDSIMGSAYSWHIPKKWPALGIGDRYPANNVNWYEAALYCNARSKLDGKDTIYQYSKITGIPGTTLELQDLEIDLSISGYRLPTEAEWEIACKAGTSTDFYTDTSKMSLYAHYYAENLNEVAQLAPNDFHLYDMLGNVKEWCNDNYGYYRLIKISNPQGPSSGWSKIVRGGSYIDSLPQMRSSHREERAPQNSNSALGYWGYGFRCVLPIQIPDNWQ